MDNQIIIKEITECGFYCSKDDVERLYIYEVIKNTNEEWLKENPEATLLIDEWIYDYTDYDDRKVYSTGGNLTVVCNDSANFKVYKIEDTKYKIYGNCGQFLIEDKPTYKEQLKRKEQEYEELNKEIHNLNSTINFIKVTEHSAINKYNKLKQVLTDIKNIVDTCNSGIICSECPYAEECRTDIVAEALGVCKMVLKKCEALNDICTNKG